MSAPGICDMEQVKDPVARRFLEEKLGDIRRIFAPVHMILFGSRAIGQAADDSDIELIVVSDRFWDVPFPDRMGTFLIKTSPSRAVDAFCYTPEEFEIMRKRIGVIADAAREGIWIQ